MTVLRDDGAGPASVNVLIVGVAHYQGYQGRGPERLPAVAISARRLAQWWMSSQSRLIPPGVGITVRLLLSTGAVEKMKDHTGVERLIDPATFALVVPAIKEWAKRPGPLSVLHWIGHGRTVAEFGGSPIHALYCENRWGKDSASRPAGIDWNDLKAQLPKYQGADRALCFVDTCQTMSRDDPEVRYPSIWSGEDSVPGGPRKRPPIVFAATEQGGEAVYVDQETVLEEGLKGGSLFSEAVRLALDRFGASGHDAEFGSAVYADTLRAAVSGRLKRWKQTLKKLGTLNTECGYSGTPNLPFVKINTPESMVTVSFAKDDARKSRDGKCAILSQDSKPPQVGSRFSEGWQADVGHGPWTAEVRLTPEVFDRDGGNVASSDFRTFAPVHRVIVK